MQRQRVQVVILAGKDKGNHDLHGCKPRLFIVDWEIWYLNVLLVLEQFHKSLIVTWLIATPSRQLVSGHFKIKFAPEFIWQNNAI